MILPNRAKNHPTRKIGVIRILDAPKVGQHAAKVDRMLDRVDNVSRLAATTATSKKVQAQKKICINKRVRRCVTHKKQDLYELWQRLETISQTRVLPTSL
jgi:hypothetical protein